MNKYNYKFILISIALIVLLILGLVGFTYSFFTAGVEGNQNATNTVLETADLRLVFNDTQIIELNNALPGVITTKTFTIENIGNINLSYDITLEDVTNTFINDELVYSITSNNGGGTITNAIVPIGEDILLSSSIDPGVIQTYTIEVKFKETGSDQNSNQGAAFSGKLQIDAGVKYLSLGGYVYDTNDNVLPNVTVEVNSDPIITTTNAYGYYEINNVPTGTHTIYIKNGETILGTKIINIKQNEEASINSDLLRVPNEYKNINIKVQEELNINIVEKTDLTLWKNSFGGSKSDYLKEVAQISDGKYIAIGYTLSTDISGITNNGNDDAMIVKYDSNGNEVWKKNFGGTLQDWFNGVISISNGFLVVGNSSSTNITGLTNKGSSDAIIIKYDLNGNEIWKKNFGGSKTDIFRGITQTADGGYITVGDSASTDITGITNKGSNDAIIVKYDSSGNEVWKKNFGGNNTDYFYSVVLVQDGYVAVGASRSTDIAGLTNKGAADLILVKYDLNGNEMWANIFGGSGDEWFTDIVSTTDGFIVSGYSPSTDITGLTNKGGEDAIIIKYDLNGNEVWKKNFGGSSSDQFQGIIQNIDGNYIAVGCSGSAISGITNKGGLDGILIKYDSNGNEIWKKNFGGSNTDQFYKIISTTDSYVAIGISNSTDIAGLINKGAVDSIIVSFPK